MKTENKSQQESEQQQETVKSATDDGNSISDNDNSNKPAVSSPVAHLWTSEDGCRPLVRPEEATSTGMLHVHDCTQTVIN